MVAQTLALDPQEGHCWTSHACILIGLGFVRRQAVFILAFIKINTSERQRSNLKKNVSALLLFRFLDVSFNGKQCLSFYEGMTLGPRMCHGRIFYSDLYLDICLHFIAIIALRRKLSSGTNSGPSLKPTGLCMFRYRAGLFIS